MQQLVEQYNRQGPGGHHDRAGTAPISPWNAAHPSLGCSQPKLVETGGAGLLYCFAID